MNKTKKTYKFILSGGGTGGHIYPALSIARELQAQLPDSKILFVGAEGRMEMQKVPQAGFPIEAVPIVGLQRKFTLKNLALPYKILKSLSRALKILSDFKPDAVIGTGGYASAPVVWAAQFKKIPVFIQEQNSYPGITNRFLGKKARQIFIAYPEAKRYFPKKRVVLTGNPVRKEILNLPNQKSSKKFFGLPDNLSVVLILGGSLGAAAVNRAVEKWITEEKNQNFALLWQTGKRYYEQYKHHANNRIKPLAYIDDMNRAYAAADIIVSRAGAGTVSELAVVGKPVILVPSPNVAEDHQTKNAMSLAKRNAAVLLPEKESDKLGKTILDLLSHPEKTFDLAKNLKAIAKPDATREIVNHILKNINVK